jgi:hypothetical protein
MLAAISTENGQSQQVANNDSCVHFLIWPLYTAQGARAPLQVASFRLFNKPKIKRPQRKTEKLISVIFWFQANYETIFSKYIFELNGIPAQDLKLGFSKD